MLVLTALTFALVKESFYDDDALCYSCLWLSLCALQVPAPSIILHSLCFKLHYTSPFVIFFFIVHISVSFILVGLIHPSPLFCCKTKHTHNTKQYKNFFSTSDAMILGPLTLGFLTLFCLSSCCLYYAPRLDSTPPQVNICSRYFVKRSACFILIMI